MTGRDDRETAGHGAGLRALTLALVLAGCPLGVAAQNAGGEFAVVPRGHVQLDLRAFPDWNRSLGTGRLSHETVEVRRLRFGVEGTWRDLDFELGVDPLDEDDGVFVKDAYIRHRLSEAVRVRIGQFKLPGSREYGTSSRRTDFLERSVLAQSLAAGRDQGAQLELRTDAWAVDGGVFAGDGVGSDGRAGLTGAVRVEWRGVEALEVAGWGSLGRTTAADTDPENSAIGRAPSGFRFFDGVYVQGRRLRVGGDVRWDVGPWRATVEALQVRDAREEQSVEYTDLEPLIARALSVTMSRAFGGRQAGRWLAGPWDVAMRYEYAGVDDAGAATDRDSVRPRAEDIRPLSVHAVTAGITWSALRWARVLADVGLETYPDTRTAPTPGRSTYLVLGTRLQLELP